MGYYITVNRLEWAEHKMVDLVFANLVKALNLIQMDLGIYTLDFDNLDLLFDFVSTAVALALEVGVY